jgi:peptidyl-prolyl cis-trans isomerase B (cyclophilin B)
VARRLIAMILSVLFMAGLVFAQEKTETKKMENEPKKAETQVKNPIVEMQTNYGNIYLEIFQKETPIHAGNFLSKVDAGKYDKLTFHRVVPNFVIQGGDPQGSGMGSMEGPSLPDEKSPFPEIRGTMAMARSNAASNCQFYINLKDNTFLDQQKFSTFAKVVKGMDVVDKIAAVKTGPGDKPVEPVVMTKLHRVDQLPSDAKIVPVTKATETVKKATEPEKKPVEPEKKPTEQKSTETK